MDKSPAKKKGRFEDEYVAPQQLDFHQKWRFVPSAGGGYGHFVFIATGQFAISAIDMEAIELQHQRKVLLKKKGVEEHVDNRGNAFLVINNDDPVGGLLGEYGPGGVKRGSEESPFVLASDSSDEDSDDYDGVVAVKMPSTKESRYCARISLGSTATSIEPRTPIFEGLASQLGLPTITSPGPCQYCEQEPCVVEQFVLEVQNTVEALEQSGQSDNQNRKELYRCYSASINGPLGKGVRVPHPFCVVDNVRRHFPNSEGKYMGFQPTLADMKMPAKQNQNSDDSSKENEF